MQLCVFEDRSVYKLSPVTLTRPAFELRCGARTLFERHRAFFPHEPAGVIVRRELEELYEAANPGIPVNDADWLRTEPSVLVNARWLPSAKAYIDVRTPHVGTAGGQVAYVVCPSGVAELQPETVDAWLDECRERLPARSVDGRMVDYAWHLVDACCQMVLEDWYWFRERYGPNPLPAELTVLGSRDQVVVADGVTVEPFVVADARNGPVLIDSGAVIQSFSRLEGPCYIGKNVWVVGGKVRGGSIGPYCRVGGEVEASIFQGYSNKYHDGFVGHSYIGEWVNLGAGTQVSDLRNDYGEVMAIVNGQRQPTGLTKVGALIGDHSKTSIGTLLNSGTSIGAFCNVLSAGSFAPMFVPSFCTVRYGQIDDRTDIRQVMETASVVMRRRGREFTEEHAEFIYALYDETAALRRRSIHDHEIRRLRKIM